MTQLHTGKFVDWRTCIQFLSSCLTVYGLFEGKLELTESDDFLVFYARPFLRDRKWSVVPLWEGDLRVILMEQRKEFPLMTVLRDRSLATGADFLYRATVERVKAPYEQLGRVGDDAAITVATCKLDLRITDPSQLFELTDTYIPYWGHSFLWPSNERFLIYTNGDNVAFIAGDRNEVEDLLGVPYEYCLERFITANSNHSGWAPFVEPYKSFCEEFS